MKMRIMGMKMQINPKMSSEATLDIFDDIGEYESWWYDEIKGIGPKMVSNFLADHQEIETINVRINSNGGDVFDGISVLNILKSSGKTINIEVIGIAASIASVIAMAGRVKMHPTSQMMIHNCWTWGCGNAKEFRKLADDMDKIMESSKIAYLDKAGEKLTEEKLQELLDGETYLTAQECYEYGLCDEIIGKEQEHEDNENPEEKINPVIKEKIEPTIEPIQKKKNWFF